MDISPETAPWKATACILCSSNCGLEAQTDGLTLTRIRGDRRHPTSAGYLCQKAQRLGRYESHADRLTGPLRRGANGGFQPVGWPVAIAEVAAKLRAIRDRHGGGSIAYYGGGGQGNHLQGAHSVALRRALGSRYHYSSLAQEKTGDFWVNGRLFGRQSIHTTEDVERAQVVLFLGCNPWQAHGIPRARVTLRTLASDPDRTMVVIDPRRTETAELADYHFALRPGTDAWLLSAMVAVIAEEGLVDEHFVSERTVGAEPVLEAIARIDVERHCRIAAVDAGAVRDAVRRFATAESACVRADLGIQQNLNSTLNSYLEKLLFLLPGHFAKPGTNNLHTQFLPVIGHSPEDDPSQRLPVTEMPAISRIYPPNLLPQEILADHPERTRALIVDSANPALTGADSTAYREAFDALELLVVIDVAMTETARAADYVLAAPSQFEKWEASFFTLEFPANLFHLRAPLVEPRGDLLEEAEIYRRLVVELGAMPERFPELDEAARRERDAPGRGVFAAGLARVLDDEPSLEPLLAAVLYSTLGRALPGGAAVGGLVWAAAQRYAAQHPEAVRRAGIDAEPLGDALFERILGTRSGTLISVHEYDDQWRFLRHPDGRIHLAIPELLTWLGRLSTDGPAVDSAYPLVLAAGERRSYNANQIYREPSWRKDDPDGALRIHPLDAAAAGIADGEVARCESRRGAIEVRVSVDETMSRGMVSLPHGYGMKHSDPTTGRLRRDGPAINVLTASDERDSLAATPHHKHVRVRVRPVPATQPD